MDIFLKNVLNFLKKLPQPAITCSKLAMEILEQVLKSKFTIKTPEQCQSCHFGVFIVNFEHITHLVLVFLFLTLSK